MITITKNEYNTLFVSYEGQHIADSTTLRRRRGFWNAATKQYVAAPGFTPSKVKKNPSMVLELLAATGMQVVAPVVVDF